MISSTGQQQSFVSPISGVVTKIYVHEKDILSYGSLILEYQECSHAVIYKDLCAVCGKKVDKTLEPSNSMQKVMAIEPASRCVKTTRERAIKYDSNERNLLLRRRKLHLLIDLDQTLVHTSNSPNHCPSSDDIISIYLDHPVAQTLYTKLRPGVKEFLTNLQSYYVFHIVTFGDRPYADAIVKLIDPKGTFFSHRILSRDDSISSTDKSANLSTLFPCGDSLVCIIDDREDVWKYASNVVRVKPYAWFHDVGDINSIYLPTFAEVKSIPFQYGVVNDDDQYLYQLEMILKHIHAKFYQIYDAQCAQNRLHSIPDLKQIMPILRQQILKSVSLCFSYLLPQDYPLESFRGTFIARAMGAQVTEDLQLDSHSLNRTTHVIAGKHTLKVHQALQSNIKVVTLEWLLDCYEQWERKPEENYILTGDYDVQKCRLLPEIIPRILKRHRDEDSAEQQTFTTENLLVKTRELNVDERLLSSKRPRTVSTTDIISQLNTDDNEDFDDDSSDDEYLGDDEVPRRWKEDERRRQ
ncbi:unnamed protein product [Adineta ricciae]|nr:unnamed protein product [Adineta ricciae]